MTAPLTQAQRAALKAAHSAINHGGLIETEGVPERYMAWVTSPSHPDQARHSSVIICGLRYRGLLHLTGPKRSRRATITEAGILELDMIGATDV